MKKQILLLIYLSVNLCKSLSDTNESVKFTSISSTNQNDLDNSQEFFTVIANRLLRINKPYRVSIQYQGYKNETVLKVWINNQKFEDFRNVALFGSGSQTVEFFVSIFL